MNHSPKTQSSQPGRNEHASRTLLVPFAGILLIYLLLLTKNYYWDGIFFAQVIEDAPRLNASLLHPNHLLYNVFGYFFYRLARGLGIAVRAVTVLQVLNCVVSTASAWVFFRIISDGFKSRYISVVLTIIFAFSATWWKFSTDADSYILSVFFLLISFFLILPGRKPMPFALATAHAFAMFFHQLAIFFFPVAVVGILLQSRPTSAKWRFTEALKYSVTVSLLTLAAFCYSFYQVTGGFALRPFVRWITTFSPEHGFTFNAWGNFVYSLRSQWRTFLGGRVGFIRDLGGPVIIALVCILAILAVIFFFKLFRHFREIKTGLSNGLKTGGPYKSLRILCALWIAVYVVFLFFFIPQNTFYRLFYLPPILILFGTIWAPYEESTHRVRRYRAALFAAIVFVANLTFSAYPYAQVRANPPLQLALRLNQVWQTGTVVYFASANTDNGLVRYFNRSTIWIEASPELLEQALPPGGRGAWLDTTLIERFQATPEGRAWLEAHTFRRPEYELVNRKYKLQFFQLNPASFK